MKPVLVGMNNPLWRGDPHYALFPAPDGCTGYRIWQMLNERTGAMRQQYLDAFERRNLINGQKSWDTTIAEVEAARLTVEWEGSGRTVILFGEDVRRSFKIKKQLLIEIEKHGCNWWLVPHPSGRNLWYNNPENRTNAAKILEYVYNQAMQARP